MSGRKWFTALGNRTTRSFLTVLFVYCASFILQSHLTDNMTDRKPVKKPEILYPFVPGQPQIPQCDAKCTFTRSMERLPHVDAVIFVHRLMVHFMEYAFYIKRARPDQIFIDLDFEPPTMFVETREQMPKNFFNATASFAGDSDYIVRYGEVSRVENPLSPEDYKALKMHEISMKVNGAYFMTQHCITQSRRESLVKELQNHTMVETLGICYNKACDASCEAAHKTTFRFYLAFENSVCDGYVTEKFFRFSGDVVPVVLRAKDYEKFGPPDSFIALDNFTSLAELGKYLTYLRNNDAAYFKYLEPMRLYHRREFHASNYLCDICQGLLEGRRPRNRYTLDWYNRQSLCDPYFINKFIFV